MQEAIVEPDRVGMGVAQVRQRVPRAHCARFDTVLPGLKTPAWEMRLLPVRARRPLQYNRRSADR